MTYYPTNNRYEKENLLRVMVKFNRKTEPDLVERMEGKLNRAGYLKQLVKEDIQRERDARGQDKE